MAMVVMVTAVMAMGTVMLSILLNETNIICYSQD